MNATETDTVSRGRWMKRGNDGRSRWGGLTIAQSVSPACRRKNESVWETANVVDFLSRLTSAAPSCGSSFLSPFSASCCHGREHQKRLDFELGVEWPAWIILPTTGIDGANYSHDILFLRQGLGPFFRSCPLKVVFG
jgi:hypothetical protein